MPGPKLFLFHLKLKTQNTNQNQSFVSMIHTYVFICPNDISNQVRVIPNILQLCFIQLQIHKFSWIKTCPKVTIPLKN